MQAETGPGTIHGTIVEVEVGGGGGANFENALGTICWMLFAEVVFLFEMARGRVCGEPMVLLFVSL